MKPDRENENDEENENDGRSRGNLWLLDPAAPNAIVGYYTQSAFTVAVGELPEAMQKKLLKYPRLPATLLGRLAREERFPRTGAVLLMDALVRAHAKDETALAFYRKFGFAPLGSDPHRVFLPMGTIEILVPK